MQLNNYKLNKLTINFLIKIDFYKTTNFLNPDTKINSIFIGKFKNHYLYDIQKIIWHLKYFFFNLVNLFKERYNIIVVNNIKFKAFNNILKDLTIYKNQTKFNKFVNFIGIINNTWYNGIISNWKVIYNLINKIFFDKKLNKSKYLKLKKIFDNLKLRNFSSPIPDLVLFIGSNSKGLKESLKFNLPLLSFIDNNANLNFFLYYALGNIKSFDSLNFLLNILELSVYKSIFIEQKTFRILILKKILTNLKQQGK